MIHLNRMILLWPIVVKNICPDFQIKKEIFVVKHYKKVRLNHIIIFIIHLICKKFLVNDEYRIIRGCGYINDTFDTIPPGAEIEDQCLRRTGTFSVMVEYCICNGENGCNHATFISINNTLLLIIMLPLLIIIMMAK